MNDLTVVCTLWKGWQPVYSARHVNALGRMMDRHMPGTRFICFTDMPAGIEYETATLPPKPKVPRRGHRDCFRRLWFFSQECARQYPGIMVNIDLDALLLDSLDSVVSDADFQILRARVCPYNGGFWSHRTGTRQNAWDHLTTPAVIRMYQNREARRWVGSDQRWLAYTLPGEPTYGEEHGVAYGQGLVKHPTEDGSAAVQLLEENRLLFFPGPPGVKPWSVNTARFAPQIHEAYMEYFE